MTDHEISAHTSRSTDGVGQGLADKLLADIAIRVQLSPTLHRQATERYRTLDEWIRRRDSPLAGLVERTYPQGSMRIGTTINSRVTDDEFDIDVVTQLRVPRDTAPRDVLDALFAVVRGKPGSRYFACTSRRGRCVTVGYSDQMHVDLTPAVRLLGTHPRESLIFEHDPTRRSDPGRSLIANPYGFAEWFNLQLPDDQVFSQWFLRCSEAYDRLLAAEPVPPPVPASQKSRVIVALQLLKRWRNVQYDQRTGRRPPSVVLSKLVGDVAAEASRCGPGLLHVLLRLAQSLRAEFKCRHAGDRLIEVANPVCPADVLTDRWPLRLAAQEMFITDLTNLTANLQRLQQSSSVPEIRRILVGLFGEAPTNKAIERHVPALPRKRVRVTPTGGVVASTAAAVHAGGRTVPRHTFHGDGEDGL